MPAGWGFTILQRCRTAKWMLFARNIQDAPSHHSLLPKNPSEHIGDNQDDQYGSVYRSQVEPDLSILSYLREKSGSWSSAIVSQSGWHEGRGWSLEVALRFEPRPKWGASWREWLGGVWDCMGFQDKIWWKNGFLREQHGGKKSKSGQERKEKSSSKPVWLKDGPWIFRRMVSLRDV